MHGNFLGEIVMNIYKIDLTSTGLSTKRITEIGNLS